MYSWLSIPALRLAIALIAGILLYSLTEATYIAIGLISLIGLALLVWPVGITKRSIVHGAGVAALVVAGGWLLADVHHEPLATNHEISESKHVILRLEESPSGTGEWRRANARAIRAFGQDGWRDVEIPVRLALNTDVVSDSLGVGSVIASSARVQKVKPPGNPHTFNFQSFLRQSGIQHQAYIRAKGSAVMKYADERDAIERLRGRLSARLEQLPVPSDDIAVAKALLLGDKSGLTKDTRSTYTSTGAIHVLAVSGLHTGVVAFMLLYMLRILGDGPGRKLLKFLLFASGLYGYVLLTGSAPSVQRSAVMFGILLGGQLLGRRSIGLNSLGLSAIVLLVFDPDLIYSIGFQLSYAAVAGILVFYPVLSKLVATRWWLVNKVMDFAMISVAATIATAPLTVYYFHQFPLAFIVSGLIAVPLVTAILPALLGATILAELLSLIGVGGVHLNWLYAPAYWLIALMNWALRTLANIPGILVQGLWPSVLTTVLIGLCVVSLGAGLAARRSRPIVLASLCWLAACLSIAYDGWRRTSHQEVITYALRRAVVTDHFNEGKLTSWQYGEVDSVTLASQILPHRQALGHDGAIAMSAPSVDCSQQIQSAGFAAGYRWVCLADSLRYIHRKALDVDWVIVPDTRYVKPAHLREAFPKADFVLLRQPPPWKRDEWKETISDAHVLNRDGAYRRVGE